MVRYFMTVREACDLVLTAASHADGEARAGAERAAVYVLKMGQPVRIADLAERMIRLAGFEPGTDGFAECMMGLHQQRAVAQSNSNLYWQAQLAEQNRRREAQQDLYKVMSLQRTGDPRFPVCGASSDGGMDRRTMTWYGPNCRAR